MRVAVQVPWVPAVTSIGLMIAGTTVIADGIVWCVVIEEGWDGKNAVRDGESRNPA
jgi:hypothetical protein